MGPLVENDDQRSYSVNIQNFLLSLSCDYARNSRFASQTGVKSGGFQAQVRPILILSLKFFEIGDRTPDSNFERPDFGMKAP